MRLDATRLGSVQHWMQSYIREGGAAADEAAALIRPSRALAPLERLDIYRGMYELRLVEALRADYPGLVRLLGEDLFDELARLYVAAHPSRSYTLNRLGDRLPEYLARVEGLPKPGFTRALARLELAETLVFDEEESLHASAEFLTGVPADQWSGLRFRPISALRLLRLDYPAHLFADAALRPKKTRLIVYRRDFAVASLSVSEPAMALFEALAEGRPLSDAVERADRAKESEIFGWFRDWFSEGLFQSVEAAQPPRASASRTRTTRATRPSAAANPGP